MSFVFAGVPFLLTSSGAYALTADLGIHAERAYVILDDGAVGKRREPPSLEVWP